MAYKSIVKHDVGLYGRFITKTFSSWVIKVPGTEPVYRGVKSHELGDILAIRDKILIDIGYKDIDHVNVSALAPNTKKRRDAKNPTLPVGVGIGGRGMGIIATISIPGDGRKNRVKSKYYSFKKWGKEAAIEKAVEWRKEQIDKYYALIR